ncbi:c-type cytochrome domain-containing protein [Rubinisphaera italica]|uniref:Planctomycete cytochrome C n=1 Tax=Rubinisphaera italica TaxID=2527969 RepID=A0A5C5XFY0_9PLAN|nr:c-type cytochrome domain-containing protein [Rubinisphaera italica]TWT61910.1 Planctomycete cytochrome C [Rubinisphaera italica]
MFAPKVSKSLNWIRRIVFVLMTCAMFHMASEISLGQLTSGQRRELNDLRREVTKVASTIRRKDYEDAKKALTSAEEALNKIMTDAGVDASDRSVALIQKAIDVQKQTLARATGNNNGGAMGGVSFAKDVAPILAGKCMGCHDQTASGGLRLDTFAGLRRGGRSGPLVVPGAPQRSPLAMKLISPPPQRMPKNGPALPADEIKTIADWITQGAKYDDDDQNRSVSELAESAKNGGMKKPEITVAKPDGTETVSFTKDIAPMLVTFCHGCHSGNNPASGLSVETFEKLLIGGDSGEVLIPGELEDSRLFRLTGGLENPRMPQGQARITRKNYEDLKAWISEGIKYDGKDPKTPILELVPSASDIRLMELRQMSEADFEKMRRERGESHWRRTLSSANPATVMDGDFLVMGNVDPNRLQQVLDWSKEMKSGLAEKVGLTAAPKWKGRLAIYVFKDRYDYDEFNRSIENRQAAKGLFGHAKVVNEFEDAYVAVLDTGDTSSADTPKLQWTLQKALISAAMQLRGTTPVQWLTEGTGWAKADSDLRSPEFERALTLSAARAIQDLNRPQNLFTAGTFAPDVTEHAGFLVVRFLMGSGSTEQFNRFAGVLRDGRTPDEACRAAYNTTAADLAKAVVAKLR